MFLHVETWPEGISAHFHLLFKASYLFICVFVCTCTDMCFKYINVDVYMPNRQQHLISIIM